MSSQSRQKYVDKNGPKPSTTIYICLQQVFSDLEGNFEVQENVFSASMVPVDAGRIFPVLHDLHR